MDKNYRLTSEEYARLLGISTEALRSRRRRGKYKNYIQDDNGNYWWENDRPYQDNTIFNDRPQRVRNGLVRLPGAKKIDRRVRRRGVLAKGEQTNYHNARNGWQLEELNRVRALTKIRDQLGDEFVDEISPELIKLAKERVQKRKEKEVEKAFTPDYNNRDPRIIGYDYTPQQYGSMKSYSQDDPLNKLHKSSLKRFLRETDVKYHREGPAWKRGLPDFREDKIQRPVKPGPYEVGVSYDDGIEVEPRSVIVEEPRFSNKIQESIHRLKNKK